VSAPVLIGLDLDGVLCDIGPAVSERIRRRFGVLSHPDTWRTYDLRQLRLGLPEVQFNAFLDETFDDPDLYAAAPVAEGARAGVACLTQAGWSLCVITARPSYLATTTRHWLADAGFPEMTVHHTPAGTKSRVAARLQVAATIEDNPDEAEYLAEVCESWLLDRPYNRDRAIGGARRVVSWGDAVGRLCQMPLFA